MPDPLFLAKILTVFAMAFLFGLERQLEHKPVGFGVYSFVGCASCALTVVGLDHAPTILMPLLGAIVTGVGFLGAGALFRQSEHISGLISAASLWTFAILGIIVGYGDFAIAGVLYLLIWVILGVNRFFEFQSFGLYQKTLFLRSRRFLSREELRSLYGVQGLQGFRFEFDKGAGEFRCHATFTGRPAALGALVPKLLADADVLEFQIE